MNTQGSPAWQERFSAENIQSYGWACIKVYEELVKLEGLGYTTLVNPSRGATPFLENLNPIHQRYSLHRSESSDIVHGLGAPFASNVITLPFTADPPDCVDSSIASFQIRDYWVRVLKAYLTGDLLSPELQFYQYVTLDLLGFEESLGAPIHRPSEKFVFMDTVVSGRAISEIERSLREHGLNDYHLLLILDKDGNLLSGPARARLNELCALEKATLVKVRSLFTEDQGPSLTGTWCISVPQLATEASIVLGHGSGVLAGSAASFIRVSADHRLNNSRITASYGRLMVMLHCLLYGEELLEGGRGVSDFFRRQLIDSISTSSEGLSPLDKRVTELIAKTSIQDGIPIANGRRPLSGKIARLEVSSSHVIRVYFEQEIISRLLAGFSDIRDKPSFWYAHNNR
jgi:hypothetical protein